MTTPPSRHPRMCFYRGSTPLTTTLSSLSKGRGCSPFSPVASPVEPTLKACGNDELFEIYESYLQSLRCNVESSKERYRWTLIYPKKFKS
jgi:hypothetical protein